MITTTLNSLGAIGCHDGLFGFNRGVRPFYAARRFDKLCRGSVSCLLNASFEKRFHNATTRFFTPKLMTMASAGAIRGK